MKDACDPSRRVWRCMACAGVNVWNYGDNLRLNTPARTVAIAHGSCFDNVCGHCGANIVASDSPILADCYTHAGDENV